MYFQGKNILKNNIRLMIGSQYACYVCSNYLDLIMNCVDCKLKLNIFLKKPK